MKAHYHIDKITDHFVLISDLDQGRSVTNDAENVIISLAYALQLSELQNKKVIYRDTMGRFDELLHKDGQFCGFAPCSEHQQQFFATWTRYIEETL